MAATLLSMLVSPSHNQVRAVVYSGEPGNVTRNSLGTSLVLCNSSDVRIHMNNNLFSYTPESPICERLQAK